MISKLMKNGTVVAFAVLTVLLGLQTGFPPSKAYAQTNPTAFYVAANGNDQTGDGSQANPFATLARAQTAVRAINGNMGNDIYVYIAAGTYYLNNGITFTEQDSGTNGYNVIYKNLNAIDSATFVGGVKVTSSWSLVTQNQAGSTWVDNDLPATAVGSVYKTNIGAGLDKNVPGILSANTNNGVDVNHVGINTLYVNDERAVLARYANKVVIPTMPSANSNYLYYYAPLSNNTQLTNSGGHLPANIQQGLTDAQNHGDLTASIFVWDGGAINWVTDTIPIGSIDTSGANDVLHFLHDANNPQLYVPMYELSAQGSAGLYFIQGNISMLDQPGEFFYDNSTGDLYYYPLAGSGPIQNQNIVYPTTETLINIQGSSRTSPAHNIVFDGLKFEDTSFPDYYTYGWNYAGSGYGLGWYPLQALGSTQPSYSETSERVDYEVGLFRLSNTNHITITNSHLKNSGMFGVDMYLANDHDVVSNSLIEDTGHGGVHLEGGYPGTGGTNVSGGYTGSDPDMDGKAAPISYNNTNTVTNSVIHDIGQLVGQTAGIELFNSGNNTFSHLDIYDSPRRAIWVQAGYNRNPSTLGPIGAPSGSSSGIVGTADDANYNPLTDMYAYNNHFEYIYYFNCEQASGDDGAFFSDWLYGFSGTDTTNYRPNYINQLIVDKIGVWPGTTEWVSPNNINLDMGDKGYVMSNVKSVNPQHYNMRFDNGPYYTITNTNFLYSGGYAGQGMYGTFDDSQMQYSQIGVSSTYPSAFSFAVPVTAVTRPTDIYFSDEFNWIDPTKWSYSGPVPVLSSLFMSEGGMAGNTSSLDLNDSGSSKTVLSRQFASNLNKIVSVKVFDRQNASYCDYSGQGYAYQFTGKTFARADDGTTAHQLGLGIDPAVNAGYYMVNVGGTETATSVPRVYGWHTLVFDYSTPGTAKLSIDGTVVNTLTGSQYNSFNYVSLGSADGTGENYFDQFYIYGGVDASPNVAPALPISGNIAPGATVTASSANSAYPASNVVDGNPGTEWASNETNPGIQLNWSVPQLVNKITLFGRANSSSSAPGGTLTFSDGSSFSISGIPSNGAPFTIAFPTRTITWVDFQVTGGQGSSVGLAEVVVYGQAAANISSSATAAASSTFSGSFPASNAIDGNVGTEWASAGEINPWLQLNWSTPQNIGGIVIDDRANLADWSQGGTLTFSDGSSISVSGIPNNGSPYAITFPTKTVSWVKFQIAGASGSANNGLAEFDVYGSPATNVSPGATATASSTFNSSYPASKATDGNVSTEWASAGEPNPWLQLNWSVPQNIGGITFNDRANLQDWSQGGTLTFSDGSSISVSGIPNNGSPYTITFPTKMVNWVKFQIAGASGSVNSGLAEFDVYGQPAANLSLTATATASSIFDGRYPASNATDGNVSTEWASAGELNPWLQLNWPAPQTIGGITFNDRAGAGDWAPGGTLTFSDGSTLTVSGIPNNGSAYTILFPAKTVSWVKFQVSGGSGSNVGLAEMQVYGAQLQLTASASPTNLALYKTVTASSQFSSAYTPQMAVDGSTSTRWAQAGGAPDPSWLEVDLGGNKAINQVSTMFEGSAGYKYKIEYSTDNSTWTLYSDKTASFTTQQANVDTNAVTARYVRITITNSSGYGGSIYEFGIY